MNRKRYLTGIDWAINALDYKAKKTTGRGHTSQIIVCLTGRIDKKELSRTLDEILKEQPILRGKTSRAWNLCPYWKIPKKSGDYIPLTVEDVQENLSFDQILNRFEEKVNLIFSSSENHLHFHLVQTAGSRTYLGMHFDHRLFDAYGAETFLMLLYHTYNGTQGKVKSKISTVEPPLIADWQRRFKAGRNLNRLRLQLSRDDFKTPEINRNWSGKKISSKFLFLSFSRAQTAEITAAVNREAGYLMLLPFLLARTLKAYHKLFKSQLEKEYYTIPVAVQKRPPQTQWRNLYFNHLSFVFFQVPATAVELPCPELTGEIRRLFYEHVKTRQADDFFHASMLTRIAPLKLLAGISDLTLKGQIGSFYFSCQKESGFTGDTLFGAKVENLFHTPHIPMPPGLGVAINFFQKKLNVTVSRAANVLNEEQVESFKNQLANEIMNSVSGI